MNSGVNGAIQARAKVNLFLHVGARRGDGFHPLQSLAVFTDAGDTLLAEQTDDLSLVVEGPFARTLGDGDNLVLKAARLLAERAGRVPAAKLTLTKNLPVASGVGGGSADAAAALRSLAGLWRLDLDEKAIGDIAGEIGSDVPVCVSSKPSFMEGRGEILTPVASLPRLPLLLVNPGVAVSTKDVFAALGERRGADIALPRGRFGDLADLLRFLETTGNDLEAPALGLQPVIGEVLKALKSLPGALFTRMSGSGATCFALMADDDGCRRAATLLKQRQPDWWVEPTFVPDTGLVRESTGRDIGPTPDGL
ncbi:MAG TPA: 4-(cytidine 5'-diphospho)-2-C-methyl-D-erythritol kinase [Rhizomicrobium sp.]|jgi:4-diphosphocytidyl-2-C-methyl-D-erythritol kinase|nr:4-(cytidine 5'-diphospho)-2-C-methyl-D-erythritol kinase [Rhizomicrobium sp.]